MKITKRELNSQVKDLVGSSLSPLNGTYSLKLMSIVNNDDAIIFTKGNDKKVTKKLSYLRILVESLVEFPAISPTQVLGIGMASIKELVIMLANTPNVGYFKNNSVTYLTLECDSHDAGSVRELLPGEASQVIGKISKFESLDRKYLLKELVNVYNTLNISSKEEGEREGSSVIKELVRQLKEFKEQDDAIFESEDSTKDDEIELIDQFSDDEDEDEDKDDFKFDPSKLDIKTFSPTIDLLMSRIKYKEIILNPDFQRKDRIWKEIDKSALIESILLKIPIPVFYMSANDNDEWLIVDGLQRLTTMYDFIKDKFALKDLKILPQYNGVKFSQFPRSLSRRINETELVVHVIQPDSPQNATTQIFQRINTKGEKLSDQEIRSSLHVGYATTFLRRLAESEEFITATNGSINDSRMKDIEYVLRFCAFYRESEYAKINIKTLDSFLVSTMSWLNREGQDSELVKKLEEDFFKAMKYSRKLFDRFAFRKKYGKTGANQINKALFETWSVGLAKLPQFDLKILESKKIQLRSDFEQLITGELKLAEWDNEKNNDKNFVYSISQSTSKNDMIQYRYKSINALIKRTICNDF